jgi:RNA polymerase sigma-B factor
LSADSGSASLVDVIGGEDPGFEAAMHREVLKSLIARMSVRDKKILLMYFFRGMTQAEIGEEIGVSQMQVSRLITRILGTLRRGFEA